MKFSIMVVGKDMGWRASNNTMAILMLEGEANWVALDAKDADRVAEFQMTELLEFNLMDEHGNRFRFARERL